MRAQGTGEISTRQSVDLEGAGYVLPAPPRSRRAELTATRGGEPAGSADGGGVAAAIGERLQLQVQSLDGLLSEIRDRLQLLDAAIAEDSRAQLKGAVREICEVVGWCEAAQQGMRAETARAASGQEPLDLLALCQQVVAARDAEEPIHVIAHRPVTCWGERAPTRLLIERALALVAARTGGRGLRCLEIDWQEHAPTLRVRSQGEPGGELPPETVAAFRAAAARAGARVAPDEHGPGGAGLLLRFEHSADAAAP
jgi:hypothetical protein